MTKLHLIPFGTGARLDCSATDALCYLLKEHGALDARHAKQWWLKDFPGVPVPLSLPSLFSPAVAAGKMVKLARGIYAAA